MYVCMYVCMYVHVCMYTCMYVCMYMIMYVCLYACMYACMYVCMYVCMHVCMHVCKPMCMYRYEDSLNLCYFHLPYVFHRSFLSSFCTTQRLDSLRTRCHANLALAKVSDSNPNRCHQCRRLYLYASIRFLSQYVSHHRS